jgi:hypothetical protein
VKTTTFLGEEVGDVSAIREPEEPAENQFIEGSSMYICPKCGGATWIDRGPCLSCRPRSGTRASIVDTIRALRLALGDALDEIDNHHREYHHRTPNDKLDRWRRLASGDAVERFQGDGGAPCRE